MTPTFAVSLVILVIFAISFFASVALTIAREWHQRRKETKNLIIRVIELLREKTQRSDVSHADVMLLKVAETFAEACKSPSRERSAVSLCNLEMELRHDRK